MIRNYIGDWRLIALRGVAAILFGIGTLVWPGVTLWALVVMWGVYAIVDGVAALTAAIKGPDVLPRRGWLAFTGLVGIAAGLIAFIWPGITALALLYVVAAWALVTGVVQIATAISMRKQIHNEWALGIAGVLSVVLSALLVIQPGAGALAITWAIGWYAVLFGGMMLALAWEVRRDTRRARTPPAGHESARRAGQPDGTRRPSTEVSIGGRPTWRARDAARAGRRSPVTKRPMEERTGTADGQHPRSDAAAFDERGLRIDIAARTMAGHRRDPGDAHGPVGSVSRPQRARH